MTEHISDLEQPWDMGPDDYSPEERKWDVEHPVEPSEIEEKPF